MSAEPPTTRWTRGQRAGYWAKLGAIVAPTVTLLTFVLLLASKCGGVEALGAVSKESAKTEHEAIEARLNRRVDDTIGRLETVVTRLEDRVDKLVASPPPKPQRKAKP